MARISVPRVHKSPCILSSTLKLLPVWAEGVSSVLKHSQEASSREKCADAHSSENRSELTPASTALSFLAFPSKIKLATYANEL